MSNSDGKTWIVRDKKGRHFGPFDRSRIVRLIEKGVFEGNEDIAEYPGGTYGPIAKDKHFFEIFLSAMSREINPVSEKQKLEELSIGAVSPKKEETNHTKTVELGTVVNRAVKKEKPIAQTSDVESTYIKKIEEPSVIDLKKTEEIKKDKRSRSAGWAIIIIAVLATVYLFFDQPATQPKVNVDGYVQLLFPSVKREGKSEEVLKKLIAQATVHFQKDTFSNYYRAQELLVEAIESGSQNTDAMALLCLTYRELWPFTEQNSKDLSALSRMSQMTSARDPVGVSGATCRIVQQLLAGQYDGAKSLIDSVLNENPTAAAIYEIKAQIVSYSGDNLNAIGYVDKTIQLWPQWLKPRVQKSIWLEKESQSQEAAATLRDVIQQNAQHATAQVLLSEIEYYRFKNVDKAVDLVKTGLGGDKLLKNIASRGYLLLALHAESVQQNAEALELAKKSYSRDPTNLVAKELIARLGGQDQVNQLPAADRELVALGEEYARTGNHLAAQAEFKTAFEVNPKNGRAAYLAALSLWELNQSIDAIQWLKKATDADADLIEGYVALADFQASRFDFAAAAQTLAKAKSKSPNGHQVLSGLALLELRRFNYKGAAELAKRSLQQYDSDIQTQLILAQALRGLGDTKSAFETAGRAVLLDGNSIKAQALYSEVLADYQGVGLALEYINNLINTYPDRNEFKIVKARILLNQQRYEETIETTNRVLEANDRVREAHLIKGRALKLKNEPRQAIQSFLSAAALDPSDAGPVYEAGETYYSMGAYDLALQQYERVIKINMLYPKARVSIGRAAFKLGDQERALREAALEKRMNPNLADSYLLSGEVFFEKRAFAQATAELQRAVALRPQASTYVLMAKIYRMQGNPIVASSLIDKAIKIEEAYPDIYREQGAVLELKGQPADAAVAYQKYVELAPNAPDKVSIQQKIISLSGGR